MASIGPVGPRCQGLCRKVASLRSGGRRLAVRAAMEHPIGALPRTPFCHYVAFPLKGKRENRWHWILLSHMIQTANPVTLTLYSSPERAIPQPSARRAVKLKNPWAEGPSILRTFLFTTLRHNPPPSGGHNPRGEAPSTFPSEPFEPFEPFHWKMLISSQNYLISINQGGFHHEVHIFRTCML